MHGIFHRQIAVAHVTNATTRKLGRCSISMALEDERYPACL